LRPAKAFSGFDESINPPPTVGAIPLCPHMGCAFKCCDFQQSGAILLYPGELEQAIAEGKSVAHLEILDGNYHQGKRARCRAADTRSCDHGYKPLDCASYPFFPVASPQSGNGAGHATLVVKDAICPIHSSQISYHRRYVAERWRALLKRIPAVESWLRSIYPDNVRPQDTDFQDLR
jgi:hypothetical protein